MVFTMAYQESSPWQWTWTQFAEHVHVTTMLDHVTRLELLSIDATMSTVKKRELLDTAVDFLSAEEHAAQDKEVLEDAIISAQALDDVGHRKHARVLRSLVGEVSWCANAGGKKYMVASLNEIVALLQDSEIQDIVRQAWREKKFRAIRMIRERSLM